MSEESTGHQRARLAEKLCKIFIANGLIGRDTFPSVPEILALSERYLENKNIIGTCAREAMVSGAAIVFFQSEKGVHFGVIDNEALVDAIDKKDPETGDDFYASGMACFEGGSVANLESSPLDRLANSLPNIWDSIGPVFTRGESE